jgi:hypothetical protein
MGKEDYWTMTESLTANIHGCKHLLLDGTSKQQIIFDEASSGTMMIYCHDCHDRKMIYQLLNLLVQNNKGDHACEMFTGDDERERLCWNLV